ncbi:hypothetical protein DL768_004815 [Monosporascus sp. mg162]|nr:hypothetical protein DL768_004815 [Monosporascus sp. mg162]
MNEFNAALASFKNETTVALAHVNIDLALIKYEAPPEFLQIGQTISRKRKESAEEGPLHRTARKLGELFKNILPNTPNLLRAYGTRVSEIATESSVNPQGTQFKDGIFSAYVGIDSGSIWAAATSGSPALAVHLLACMLARSFTIEQATSIWVELVEKQKESLESSTRDDLYPDGHVATRLALSQDISRRELSGWDASARAWLQSADQAKLFQHKQMEIIINDSAIPVNSEPTVYKSVTTAWIGALGAMENLVQGVSQKVQDGAALLAISAWHLYPDMIVYRGQNGKGVDVKINDALFQPTALLTIGLEAIHPGSVSWSLPLARMQYYGELVQVTASTGQDNTRITPEELSFVVLGGILFTWATSDFTSTIKRVLFWLDRILACSELKSLEEYERGAFHLLFFLHGAAKSMATSQGMSTATALQLFKLGHRRSGRFLDQKKAPPPLFSLNEIFTLIRLFRLEDGFDAVQKINLIYGGKYPRFLIQSKSKGSHRLVFSANSSRWVAIEQSEAADYLKRKHVPPQLKEELTKQPCLPILIRTIRDAQKDSHKTYVDVTFGEGPDCFSAIESLALGNSWKPFVMRYTYWNDTLDGNISHSELLLYAEELQGQRRLRILDDESMESLFTPDNIDPTRLRSHLLHIQATRSFQIASACAAAISVLRDIPGVTVTTRILERSLDYSVFFPDETFHDRPKSMSLRETFALLCAMDSGVYIDPHQLSNAFALATGNSIYVASAILSDPHEAPYPLVRRVIGNIGRAGLCFMVPPANPKISPPSDQNWRIINHNDFDGKVEDNFENTSVHLSFTGYELGLRPSYTTVNSIDHAVKIVETAVSAYDGSKWVADLDILIALNGNNFPLGNRFPHGSRQICGSEGLGTGLSVACTRSQDAFGEIAAAHGVSGITAIDNWDEILDPPQSAIIAVRAAGNWVARLALVTVCAEKGQGGAFGTLF